MSIDRKAMQKAVRGQGRAYPARRSVESWTLGYPSTFLFLPCAVWIRNSYCAADSQHAARDGCASDDLVPKE